MPIESPGNQKIKLLRSLATRSGRAREGLFLVEGVRLIETALAAGAEPTLVLYDAEAPAAHPRLAELLHRAPAAVCWDVVPAVLQMVADTVTTQGVVAAFPIREVPLPATGLIVVADALADPGNVGTLLRAAAAAGAAAVAYLPGTADPFSPKVVRSAAGAHWHVPIVRLDLAALRDHADRGGWIAAPRDGAPYDRVEWRADGFLIIGSEAHGARTGVAALGFDAVTIPQAEGVESLNSAVAAAVLLFEARRQAGDLSGVGAAPPVRRGPRPPMSRPRSGPGVRPRPAKATGARARTSRKR